MASTAEILASGKLADRYRIRDRLGHGGMATVFLAEDCVLGRDVAIKRLHTEGSETDEQRFRREARVGASLIHPNLVTIFDTINGPDGTLIVMEYVRGRPLSELISPEGMDPRRLLEVLRPVAAALDYAHDNGVVHRDVKPANVLIGEDRTVKLVDLGAATAAHATKITSENEVLGTLAYIAPERLAGETVGEPASDIYSLAVLAFEALTGRQPFRGETPAAILDEVQSGRTPDLQGLNPRAPARVAEVLERGMDPDPDERQASAGLLVREIETALPGTAVATGGHTEPMTPPTAFEADPPPTPPPSEPVPDPRDDGRSRWLAPALVAICALLIGGIVFALAGGDGGDQGKGGIQKQASASGKPHASSGGTGPPPATPVTPTTPAATGAEGSASPATASGSGAQLNDEGYSLIQEGRYDEAVPVLKQAVNSFPAGTADITYAYALYNLGHALRLAGRPDEAIPVLERRLQIPDQTETVQRELDAARAAAGQ